MDLSLNSLSPEILSRIVNLQIGAARAGLDLPMVMQTLVNGIQRMLNPAGTVIEFLEGNEMVYRAVSENLPQELVGLRLKLDASLSGLAVKLEKTLRTDDVLSDLRVDKELCKQIGIYSMIVTPFKTPSGVKGVVKIFSENPFYFTVQDELILEVLTGTLSASLNSADTAQSEKIRHNRELQLKSDALEKSLKEVETHRSQLVAVFQSVNEGLIVFDPAGMPS